MSGTNRDAGGEIPRKPVLRRDNSRVGWGRKRHCRIVDLLFAVKNKQGDVKVLEFGDLDPDIFGQWDPLVSDVTPMLNEDDAREDRVAGEQLLNGALALREHLGDALRRRGQQRPRRSSRQRAHPARSFRN